MSAVKRILLDPYCVATLFFVAWICFCDEQNIYAQYNLYTRLKKFQEERSHYTARIQKIRHDSKALLENKALLEKIAREKYYMKRKQEDIYVIIRDVE